MPDEVETDDWARRASATSRRSATRSTTTRARTTCSRRSYDGIPFPPQPFSAARYAGFGDYYAVPDLGVATSIRSSSPTTQPTLEVPPPFPDTPQAAYYYVYTGPETLELHTRRRAPQLDTRRRPTSRPAAAPGPGATSRLQPAGASRTNFAIWYSFYRTRISPRSRARPAWPSRRSTTRKRVGFITVRAEGQRRPPAAINPLRYLPLGDFNPGPRPEGQVVRQAVRADAQRRLAGARRPGSGRPLLRRQGRRHQHGHAGDGRERPGPVHVPAELHDHDHRRLLERPDRVARPGALRRRPAARRHHQGRPAGRRSSATPYSPRPMWDGDAPTPSMSSPTRPTPTPTTSAASRAPIARRSSTSAKCR